MNKYQLKMSQMLESSDMNFKAELTVLCEVKEIKTVKENQMEVLKLENTISEKQITEWA